MHDRVVVWDDKVPVDDGQVMIDGHAGCQRDAHASDGTAVVFAVVRRSGDVNGNDTTDFNGRVAPVS